MRDIEQRNSSPENDVPTVPHLPKGTYCWMLLKTSSLAYQLFVCLVHETSSKIGVPIGDHVDTRYTSRDREHHVPVQQPQGKKHSKKHGCGGTYMYGVPFRGF